MAPQNPFETVTPQQWVERTKVSGLARRPDTLKKIDQLYDRAHGIYPFVRFYVKFPPKGPAKQREADNHKKNFLDTLIDLLTAFDRYLQEHKATPDFKGPDGKDLHRNQLSKGLMKEVYNYIRDYVGVQAALPHQDARHTRVGVLYLLGHTHANVNTWSVASAAVNIGGSGLGKIPAMEHAAKAKSIVKAAVDYKQAKATVKNIADSVSQYFQFREASFYSTLGSLIRTATDFVLSMVTKAAPLIGAVMDVAQGFIKVASAVANYLRTKRDRVHFLLTPGHPLLLAQKIESEMLYDITNGIIQIGKGAASALAGAASGGFASRSPRRSSPSSSSSAASSNRERSKPSARRPRWS